MNLGVHPDRYDANSTAGAYSTLFYAQFLLQYNGKPEVPVSATNICTFGSPRLVVGQKDHVEAGICGRLAAILKNGGPSGVLNSWRIVNRNDICPTIPPVLLLKKYEFNHVDAGTQIFKNAEPQKLKSELGVGIPPVYQKGHWFDHSKSMSLLLCEVFAESICSALGVLPSYPQLLAQSLIGAGEDHDTNGQMNTLGLQWNSSCFF